MEKVTEAKAGQRVRVTKIRGPGELHRKLRGLGISLGREIEIRIGTPTKSTVMVKVGVCVLPLCRDDAERIYVEPVASPAPADIPGREEKTEQAGSRCAPPQAVLKEADICP